MPKHNKQIANEWDKLQLELTNTRAALRDTQQELIECEAKLASKTEEAKTWEKRMRVILESYVFFRESIQALIEATKP